MARADFYAVTAQLTVAAVLVLAVGVRSMRGEIRHAARADRWMSGFIAFFLSAMTMAGVGSCLYALYHGTDTDLTRTLALSCLGILVGVGVAFAVNWATSFGEPGEPTPAARIDREPESRRLGVAALIVVLVLARRRG